MDHRPFNCFARAVVPLPSCISFSDWSTEAFADNKGWRFRSCTGATTEFRVAQGQYIYVICQMGGPYNEKL